LVDDKESARNDRVDTGGYLVLNKIKPQDDIKS
jgi:hypothetical protein